MKRAKHFLEWHFKDRYYYMFLSLVMLILLPPFLLQFDFLSFVINILVSIVVINCVLILFNNSQKSGYGIGVLIIALAFMWITLSSTWQISTLEVIRMIVLVLFFGFTLAKMVREIFKLKRVTARVVIGAIGAYLLLGLMGAVLFETIDILFPASFSGTDIFTTFYGKIYFSFVTISTLGYGDISPLTPQGQAAAILVSVSGQLYLAVLMAMLVGKFLKDAY